jgi:hypothetical protein
MPALTAPGGTQSVISYATAMGYWVANGGSPKVANIAAAIAEAESDLDPTIVQTGQPAEDTGWGLWQITPTSGISQNGQFGDLLNPANNAKAAVYLYKQAGDSFSPWVTYQDGSYKAFVGNGSADLAGLTPATGDPGSGGADCIFGGESIGLGLTFPCLLSRSGARAMIGGAIIAAGGVLGLFGAIGLASASGALGAAEKLGGGAAEAAGAVATFAGNPEVGAPLMKGGSEVRQHGTRQATTRAAQRRVRGKQQAQRKQRSDEDAQERHTASQYKRQPRARANAQRDNERQPAPF